jgi:ankyrin repeat protein
MNAEWLYEVDAYGETPLTRVSKSGRMEVANIMFLQEISDALREITQLPALHRAAYWGYEDAVTDLLEDGVDPEAEDLQGETALHKAVRLGNLEAVDALLDNGADVNAQSALGLTPLHWAALTGQKDISQQLLDRGASMHARDWVTGGMTPLDFARLLKYDELAEMLDLHMSAF